MAGGVKEKSSSPNHEKGRKGGKVEDYRGVTLTQAAYKIYVIVLANWSREKVESKIILSPCQTGFRKGMGTIDQTYVLNYLINRKVAEEKEKMLVMFIDIKRCV